MKALSTKAPRTRRQRIEYAIASHLNEGFVLHLPSEKLSLNTSMFRNFDQLVEECAKAIEVAIDNPKD